MKMQPVDKLHAILEHIGITMDGRVKDEGGHEYHAWPPAVDEAVVKVQAVDDDGKPVSEPVGPSGSCPYEFEELPSGRRRLTIKHPNGDRYAATGATNAEAIDAMVARFKLTFTSEGKVDGK